MADYYPLIARAIEGLADRSPDTRRAVYGRAQQALRDQLRSLDPPLSEAEIAREEHALEEAIARAESNFGEPPAPAQLVSAEPPGDDAYQEVRPSLRPRVERQPAIRRGGRRGRPLILAIALLVVIAPLAVLAWLWRDRPVATPEVAAPVATTRPEVAPTPSESKFAERVGGAPAPASPSSQSGSAPATASAPATPKSPAETVPLRPTTAAPADPNTATAPAQPDLAVAQRAILVEENATDPQQPKIQTGRAIWRMDAVNGGQGQPLETVVRASVDIPEAGLNMVMLIRRNTDTALPASHTIELSFTSTRPGEPRVVRDVALPMLRPEENIRGVPIAGLSVPVKENVFLIGLSDLKADVDRNTDLLLHRNWIELPLRFASGERAALVFEKGVSGDRILADAFRQWQQQ